MNKYRHIKNKHYAKFLSVGILSIFIFNNQAFAQQKCGERPDLRSIIPTQTSNENTVERSTKSAELSPLLFAAPQASIQFQKKALGKQFPPAQLQKDPTLVVRKAGHIHVDFTFETMMNTLANSVKKARNNNAPSPSGEELFKDWWHTALPFTPTNVLGCAPNKGNDSNASIQSGPQTSINGFPYECGRPEGRLSTLNFSQKSKGQGQAPNIPFEIVSLVNRGDLLSLSPTNDLLSCGEYRVVVRASCGPKGDAAWCTSAPMNFRKGHIYASFEFEPPIESFKRSGNSNINTLAICKTVQGFWRDLANKKTENIAEELRKFYFDGTTITIEGTNETITLPPIIDARHLGLKASEASEGFGLGQLRTNIATSPSNRWHMREYAFRDIKDIGARIMPVSLGNNLDDTKIKQPPNSFGENSSCENSSHLGKVAQELCSEKEILWTDDINQVSQLTIEDNCLYPGEITTTGGPRDLNSNIVDLFSRDPSRPSLNAAELRSRVRSNLHFRSCAGCHTGNGASNTALKHLINALKHQYPSAENLTWTAPEFVHSIETSGDGRIVGTNGSQIMENLFLPLRCASIQMILNNTKTHDPFNCIKAE